MTVVMAFILHIFITLAVISLTWLTLPGADVISSEYIVCIESIITNLGWISSIVSSILLISVSPKKTIFSFFISNRSALIFICSADSSPETYNTFPSTWILSHICKIKVDLPIPGSPPRSVREPLTKPPPRTLSNSSKPDLTLAILIFSIEFNETGSDFLVETAFVFPCLTTFSSTKVFHALHAGHFPSHLADSYPHSLQKNTVDVLAFAI